MKLFEIKRKQIYWKQKVQEKKKQEENINQEKITKPLKNCVYVFCTLIDHLNLHKRESGLYCKWYPSNSRYYLYIYTFMPIEAWQTDWRINYIIV